MFVNCLIAFGIGGNFSQSCKTYVFQALADVSSF